MAEYTTHEYDVLVIGAGAVGAGPALRRLAELLGAPLATTLRLNTSMSANWRWPGV